MKNTVLKMGAVAGAMANRFFPTRSAAAGKVPLQIRRRTITGTQSTTNKLMTVLLAGFTTLTTAVFAQGVPHKGLPARTVTTNGATVLPDRSFVPAPPGGSPAAQPSPATTTDFQALTDNNFLHPPDTMGTAGFSNVVTMLNTQVRIQSRTRTTT